MQKYIIQILFLLLFPLLANAQRHTQFIGLSLAQNPDELMEELIEKVPIDGLCGQTDEDKLGFTYETLDKYIRDGIEPEPATKARIDRLYALNRFKVRFMDVFPYQPEE